MIQSPLSPSLTLPGVPSQPGMTAPLPGAETADFGAFLASLSPPDAAPAETGQPDAALPGGPVADPANAAIPGKILPPGLPVAELVQLPIATAQAGEVPADAPTKPTRGGHSVQSAEGLVAKVRPAKVKTAHTEAAETPETECAHAVGKAPELPALKPEVAPVSEALEVELKPQSPIEGAASANKLDSADLHIPVMEELKPKSPAAPDPTTPISDRISPSKAQGPVQRTVPVLPDNASEQAQLRNAQHRAEVPADPASAVPAPLAAKPDQPVMRPLPRAAKPVSNEVAARQAPLSESTAAPQPVAAVRIELPLPLAASAGRRATPEVSLALPIAAAADNEITAEVTPALASGSAAPQSAPLAAANPAPALRPHDFTALIDRLSAAREAFAPQAVSITVSHQEFGPVRLNFLPEDAGLNVTVISPDPDFARAAAAVPAPVLPLMPADPGGSALQQRSDGGSAQSGPGAEGFAQSRGGSSDRREGNGQHHSDPSQRSNSERQPARRGIFA